VAKLGEGGAISLMDLSTIYDRGFVDLALDLAKEDGIKAQIKRYVSGGNDAGHIHKSLGGVKTLAISAPTRYLHSACCVASVEDYFSIKALVSALLEKGRFEVR
jgi:endoglucanase